MTAPPEISPRERQTRRARFAERIREAGLACGVAFDPATVTYLTGNVIAGPNAVIVGTRADVTVLCDGYDAHNFDSVGDGLTIETYPYTEPLADHVVTRLKSRLDGGDAVGVEYAGMAHTTRRVLDSGLDTYEMVSLDRIIGDLRLVKSDDELAVIRKSAALVGDAHRTCADLLTNQTSEPDLAKAVYQVFIDGGSDYPAGQPYIKSGPRALMTHARWGQRAVDTGDHVLLELGACVQRYHAALMRSRLAAGGGAAYQRGVEAVVEARDAHLAALKPGLTAEALHEVCLGVLDRHGVRAWNRHSSGYSLGLAFPPYWGEIQHLTLNLGVTRRLEAGMVLHVIAGLTEPAQEIPHIGLSECVVITENGYERLIEVDDFL